MDILIKALQLILSLSILVITHEFGHFAMAKLFKTRVEKFYLFFDPWFSLFKIKRGDTEYGIGWLPLGGYVKIAGMIDESMDIKQMSKEPEPWEFRSKPAWQRLFIMIAGVVVNFLSALIIFWMILFTWGESYLPLSESNRYGLEFHQTMLDLGFENGDKIEAVNGVVPETCGDVVKAVLLEDKSIVDVDRDGEKLQIKIPEDFNQIVLKQEVKGLCAMRIPVVVDSVMAGMPAETAGIQKGDSIISVNGKDARFFGDFTSLLSQHKNEDVQLALCRDGLNDTLTVKTDEAGRIGIFTTNPMRWLTPKVKQYGFFAALPAGIGMGVDVLMNYVKQIKLVFSKEGVKQLGGFVTIGNMFPNTWDWMTFWFNTAFLAIILAFMNILPIPALDGGHVLFLIYEIVSGRKPSDKFLEYAQIIGMALLFGLLIYANGNDFFKAIFK